MLTKRQTELLQLLLEKREQWLTSGQLAEVTDISVRTVKKELELLRHYLVETAVLTLKSSPSKGYCLKVSDPDGVDLLKEQVAREQQERWDLNEKSMRVKLLLSLLLRNKRYISKYGLLEKTNVSESTLYQDIKVVKRILEQYNLKLIYKSETGYMVTGYEIMMRKCILEEDIFVYDQNGNAAAINENVKTVAVVKNTILKVLLDFEYQISESLFENLIIHIVLSMKRMQEGHLLEDQPFVTEMKHDTEYQIAHAILLQCAKELRCQFNDNEIKLLAVNLKCKQAYYDQRGVSDEINRFITESLLQIKDEFGVNLSNDVELKVNLALHFVPLLTRMKNNMQLKNHMMEEIKVSFPFAFDIAYYFSQLVYRKYNVKLSEDELSYITLYFCCGLENLLLADNPKRILVVSPLMKSENVLIRQKLLQWFHGQISELTFVDQRKLSDELIRQYDLVLTTDEAMTLQNCNYVCISLFPKQADFLKMNLAINGYTSVESILARFDRQLFFMGTFDSKEAVIGKLIEMARGKYCLTPTLEDAIYARENMGSTYFVNKVAIPHPLYPICNVTFVAVVVLENELEWGDPSERVRLAMLVCTEMNNLRSFQVWHYLSSFVNDAIAMAELCRNPDYETLLRLLRRSLTSKF